MASRQMALVAGGVAAIVTGPAFAGFTTVSDSGETTVAEILNQLLGSSVSLTDVNNGGLVGTVGTTKIYRMNDTNTSGNPLDALRLDFGNATAASSASSSITDQLWVDGTVNSFARARFAGFSQEFGRQLDNAAHSEVFEVNGSGFNVTGSDSMGTITGNFTLSRADQDGTNAQFSDPTQNANSVDQMITFYIDRQGAVDSWLVFFEDIDDLGRSDRDFNDLVIEIRAVPLPTTGALAGLGLLGMCGLGFARRRSS